ncbi:hypothetical protein [Promicromonospora sp. NPDC090134]|uniref:hypothetical protein n=1 Tax=Promicromonospora sp. NPDC090134 TaxID=3364408 RepID=UPI00382D5493
MAMSRLQRIAADLLEFYQKTDTDLQLLAELAQATQDDANLLGSVAAYEAAVKSQLLEDRGQVIESSLDHLTALLQGAVTSLTTTYDHVRVSGAYARAWAEQTVTDTATGVRVPDPGLRDKILAAHPDRLPPAQVSALLDDAIQEQIDQAKAEEKESWRRLFATYPRGTDHLTKARWFARNAVRDDIAPYQRAFLRGMWFNHAAAYRFRTTEVYINKTDPGGKTERQYRVDALGDDEVVSLKHVQLADVTFDTAKRYIDEILTKYRPGRMNLVIAPTPGNTARVERAELFEEEIGQPLAGAMVLGVPPQAQPVPERVAQYAREKRVEISEYQPHPDAEEPR